jgi:glutathione S-transferase
MSSSTSTLPPFKLPPSVSESASPKLHLYTQATPNGYKASIYLEELIAAYGPSKVAYDYSTLSFQESDQKKPEFLKINPNGRIPALVDENFKDPITGGGFAVFETASILLWLTEKYDTESKFWFAGDDLLRSKALSWIFFAHGGVGPMQGELKLHLGEHLHGRERKEGRLFDQSLEEAGGRKADRLSKEAKLTSRPGKPLPSIRAGKDSVCYQ